MIEKNLNCSTPYNAHDVTLKTRDWSFSGPFGTFDKAAMQRGFQVYNEVCAGCHSLKLIAFRNFADLGYLDHAKSP